MFKARQQTQGRGLPATGWAEQRNQCAGFNGERKVRQSGEITELLRHVLKGNGAGTDRGHTAFSC